MPYIAGRTGIYDGQPALVIGNILDEGRAHVLLRYDDPVHEYRLRVKFSEIEFD